jgi:DNA repair exonuclease SbcCD ATPase subunit
MEISYASGLEVWRGMHIFKGAGCNHPHALSQSTFPKPAILREGDPKNQKQKTDMKNMIMKLLGLESLVNDLALLKKQNEELKTKIENLENEVSEMEIPEFDADDFVREDDVNDRIESYLNDNDYCSSSYVDDEIESKVSEKVEEAIEDLDLTDKVKEVVDDMDKASFGDTEELSNIVKKVVKKFVLDSVDVRIEVR